MALISAASFAAATWSAFAAILASNTLLFDDDVTDEDLEDSWSDDDKETTTPAMPSADSETVLNVELDAEAAIAPGFVRKAQGLWVPVP